MFFQRLLQPPGVIPYLLELERPAHDVEERALVVPVVVGVVRAHVDRRGDDGGLVAVQGVVPEEAEDLLCDLGGRQVAVLPLPEQADVGGPGPELLDAAMDAEDGELGVGEAHLVLRLVILRAGREREQFCRGSGVQEFVEYGEIPCIDSPLLE